MLNAISWTDFFISVFFAAFLYYLYVIIKYYPGDIRGKLLSKSKSPSDFSLQAASLESAEVPLQEETVFESAAEHFETEVNEDIDEVDKLLSEIKTLIEGQPSEDILGDEIAKTLSKYPNLGSSPFRPSLNELILSEIDKNILAHHFELAEVDKLWDKAV